jgi:hypothetical protein
MLPSPFSPQRHFKLNGEFGSETSELGGGVVGFKGEFIVSGFVGPVVSSSDSGLKEEPDDTYKGSFTFEPPFDLYFAVVKSGALQDKYSVLAIQKFGLSGGGSMRRSCPLCMKLVVRHQQILQQLKG